MRIRILPRAQRDLMEIDAWISVENLPAARKVMKSLLDGMEQLARHPKSAPVVRDVWLASRGFRCLSRGRYAVFFKVHNSTVVVYRVLHQRREWAHLL